jgi:hypothetical protein
LPDLERRRSRTTVYRLVAVDNRGRIADREVYRALGWPPGARVDIREQAGLVLVVRDPQGVFSVDRRGHLRLPAAARRWCGIAVGDRVLLAAEPDRGVLVVHPAAALDAMVTEAYRALLGGAAA